MMPGCLTSVILHNPLAMMHLMMYLQLRQIRNMILLAMNAVTLPILCYNLCRRLRRQLIHFSWGSVLDEIILILCLGETPW